jgi:hypothetical protein
MTNYNKTLLLVTAGLLIVVAVIYFLGINFYNWALWLVPLFFYILTLLIIRFVIKKLDDKFLPVRITQASLIKLLLSLGFLILFKLFLTKSQWINFIIFSAVNYLIYTAYEVNYLLSRLR